VALAPLLAETFGVILYQEQVLRIAHELAGFSLAEADLLRRAMSHFDPGRLMQELERKFVSQANERSGVPVEIGERVWEMMAAFAGYGFPKAHAASYAKVAWRSAWCKTHFPAEFMAAVLANWGGYYSQSVYLGEARRLGLTVRPPHVSYSGSNFVVASREAGPEAGQKILFMGLDQVRNLTRRTIGRILRGRPFTSLEDFLTRVDPPVQEAADLAQVGAFEGWGTIPAILRRLQSGGWQSGQPSLFDFAFSRNDFQDDVRVGHKLSESTSEEDWTLKQKVAAQQELLGVSLEAHPLELLAGRISASGAIPTVDAAGRVGQRVTVAGIRQSGHRSRTSKGDLMFFMTLEDMAGMLDVAVFPDVYRLVRGFIHSAEPLLVTGLIKTDPGRAEPLLVAEKVKRLV
jgi:DNA polymerase III alpha subunit